MVAPPNPEGAATTGLLSAALRTQSLIGIRLLSLECHLRQDRIQAAATDKNPPAGELNLAVHRPFMVLSNFLSLLNLQYLHRHLHQWFSAEVHIGFRTSLQRWTNRIQLR